MTSKWLENYEQLHFKPNSINGQINWGLFQCVILMMESHSVVSQAVAFSYCITCKTFVWVCRTSFEHHLDLSVLKKKKWKLQFWQNFEILLLCWRQFISSAKKWCSRSQKLRHHRRGKKAIFQKVDHSFSRVNDLFCIFSVEVKKNKNQGQHNFNQ